MLHRPRIDPSGDIGIVADRLPPRRIAPEPRELLDVLAVPDLPREHLDEVTAPERRVLAGGLDAPEVVGLEGEAGLAEGALVRGVRRGRLRVHPRHLSGECTHLGYELRLGHTVSSFPTRKPPAAGAGGCRGLVVG